MRRNAFKHGKTARTLMHVLPQEQPEQDEAEIEYWTSALLPRNAAEGELVVRIARVNQALERGERIETAHLAERVKEAGRERSEQVSVRRLEEVRELGRKLIYVTGPPKELCLWYSPFDDDPAIFLQKLERTAAGCRWLLERWAEYRSMLDRKVAWSSPVMVRFIRLQGKQVIEAGFDAQLNSIFLALEVLQPNFIKDKWELILKRMPFGDPAIRTVLFFTPLADPPKDKAEAWKLLEGIVEKEIGRLKGLLARREVIEAAADDTWADRAAPDTSAEFERHRRSQSARHRELIRLLQEYRKMRKEEFAEENEQDECQMGDDKWQMANDKWQ